MKLTCARALLLVSLVMASCGDPVAPPALSSHLFQVDVRLERATISVSDPSSEVVMHIRVRNPYPVAATVRQPMPDYSSHLWWTVRLESVALGGSVASPMINGFEELTIPAYGAVQRTVVLGHYFIAGQEPGEYRLLAGPLWQYGAPRRLTLTP